MSNHITEYLLLTYGNMKFGTKAEYTQYMKYS
jgi:hypothetical protein